MPVSEFDQMLFDATAEVLETMFFTTPAEDAEPAPAPEGPWISARMTFRNAPSGKFGIRTPMATGRKLASSFLGLDEESISEAQIGEVVCELANMLCGSVLSRLDKSTCFELSSPVLAPAEAGCPESAVACRMCELDEGPVAVWLELEQPYV